MHQRWAGVMHFCVASNMVWYSPDLVNERKASASLLCTAEHSLSIYDSSIEKHKLSCLHICLQGERADRWALNLSMTFLFVLTWCFFLPLDRVKLTPALFFNTQSWNYFKTKYPSAVVWIWENKHHKWCTFFFQRTFIGGWLWLRRVE